MKIICKCGNGYIGRNGKVCRKCHEEFRRSEREIIQCKKCSGDINVSKLKARYYKLHGGIICRKCQGVFIQN